MGIGKMNFVRKIIRSRRAATAIEYGLIAALIAVSAVAAMSTLGKKVSTTFNNVNTNMKAT
jgi:pilus assembly protein Flp/PilA